MAGGFLHEKGKNVVLATVLMLALLFLLSPVQAQQKQQYVNIISQAGHAYWDQRAVIPHPVDGNLYGYSGEQTVVDPANPYDRFYKTDGPFVAIPHIFHEVENSPGHPGVGYAYVRAYEATGDKFMMRAAKDLGDTLLSAQRDIGAGGWWQDMGTIGYDRRVGSPTQFRTVNFGKWMNFQAWGGTVNAMDNDQGVSSFDGCSYPAGLFLLRLYQALPASDPDRDSYLQGAKWLADEIVGFKDVVDNPAGFKPYGGGGVPQIWPYNTMKGRTGYEAWPGYPYTTAHNVMVTLNDDAMGGAMFFVMEFWKEAQTNPGLNEQVYLDAIRLNADYLMDRFDAMANANGNSAWADFYWIDDGSPRAGTPTWGRAYEPPGLSSITVADEILLGWWQNETDAARKARIEDVLKRQFLYFKYDAVPVNSDAPGGNPDLWRDLISPYIRNGSGAVYAYDLGNMNTWYWWRWYNADTSAAPREVFVGAETPRATSHYDVHYDLDALDQANNPDSHYPMMVPHIRIKMTYAFTAQDQLWLFDPTNQGHNSQLIDRYDLVPEVRAFAGRPNPGSYVGTAVNWFDPATGFFMTGSSLPTLFRNNKNYPYVKDSLFQTGMRYIAHGAENDTGALTDSDGDGHSDVDEGLALTDPLDSEVYPGHNFFCGDGTCNTGENPMYCSTDCGGGAATCITTQALLGHVTQWEQGSLPMTALMSRISSWKAGTGCP
jgi:hypothetical protein